jgi:hypothetical protein
VKRERRSALIARGKFLAGSWLAADIASADCWDGYTDEEVGVIIGAIRTISDGLIRNSGTPYDDSPRSPEGGAE